MNGGLDLKYKRLIKIAVAMTALFLGLFLIFSGLYVGIHAEHDCIQNNDCPICMCIESCKKLTDETANATIIAYAIAMSFGFITILLLLLGQFKYDSLVKLKIRLNN